MKEWQGVKNIANNEKIASIEEISWSAKRKCK